MTYQSFDGHGVDVAVKRADDLDKRALAYITANPGCQVLDLGSGVGGQSLRMVAAGAWVTAVDQFDFAQSFSEYKQPSGRLVFKQGKLQHITQLFPEQSFAIAVCQRTIHYLSYSAAQTYLKQLHNIVQDKLFISVTGISSLVGDTYPCNASPIKERFCELSDVGKEMFSIVEPVCLYTQVEFIRLLESAGWTVDECWESAFGNSKAVCSK